MRARHVVVTAGAAGIGLAIARLFRDRGDEVTICDVDSVALAHAAADADGLKTVKLDVADAGAVEAFGKSIEGVDVLINNAGIAGPRADIAQTDPVEWARCFAVNVHGPFHMIRSLSPHFVRQGGGSVINISTASTVTGLPRRTAYVASKWALEGLTRNLARELGPLNVRVNAIRPGFMDTERMRGLIAQAAADSGATVEAVEQEALGFISLRTKIQPEEIGEMAYFLASDASRHVTGQIIGVDGNAEWEG